MVSFITIVVTYDLREVLFRAFRSCFVEGHISFISKKTSIGALLFMCLFLKPFYRLFPSLLGGFCIVGGNICGLGVLAFCLKHFDSKVFHYNALNLYFSCDDVSKTIFLLSLVVYFFDIKSRLEACFGLNLDYFLDYLFPNI